MAPPSGEIPIALVLHIAVPALGVLKGCKVEFKSKNEQKIIRKLTTLTHDLKKLDSDSSTVYDHLSHKDFEDLQAKVKKEHVSNHKKVERILKDAAKLKESAEHCEEINKLDSMLATPSDAAYAHGGGSAPDRGLARLDEDVPSSQKPTARKFSVLSLNPVEKALPMLRRVSTFLSNKVGKNSGGKQKRQSVSSVQEAPSKKSRPPSSSCPSSKRPSTTGVLPLVNAVPDDVLPGVVEEEENDAGAIRPGGDVFRLSIMPAPQGNITPNHSGNLGAVASSQRAIGGSRNSRTAVGKQLSTMSSSWKTGGVRGLLSISRQPSEQSLVSHQSSNVSGQALGSNPTPSMRKANISNLGDFISSKLGFLLNRKKEDGTDDNKSEADSDASDPSGHEELMAA